jgi:NADH:ubiquinone oxidoreductase subunit 5 (subunit L)/multisubunit Na+/H+ antiporter MnhA subunit
MGGFSRLIPLTAVTFLVGSIAICGLPPFNGFVSEFIIYKGLFRAGSSLVGYAPLALLFTAVGLAFTGGLAVACFTKLYGIVFLGQNRLIAAVEPLTELRSSSAALLCLAALCALTGFVPITGLSLVSPALHDLPEATSVAGDWASPLNQLLTVFLLFLALVLAVSGAKFWIQKRRGIRRRETWSCGYLNVSPRMQYTASGFAEELVTLGRPMLRVSAEWKPLQSVLPLARTFHSHCQDRIEDGYFLLNRAIEHGITAFRWIQSGSIRQYVLYLFAAVAFYLLCALIW